MSDIEYKYAAGSNEPPKCGQYLYKWDDGCWGYAKFRIFTVEQIVNPQSVIYCLQVLCIKSDIPHYQPGIGHYDYAHNFFHYAKEVYPEQIHMFPEVV